MNYRYVWIAALWLLLPGILFATDKPKFGPVPRWVKPIDPDLNAEFSADEVGNGMVYLLTDNQHNQPLHEAFFHTVYKVENTFGVQEFSEIGATWDPKTEVVTFHYISVIRDGVKTDRLIQDNFTIMQLEPNLQMHLYDGRLSALTALADIRPGDIIEYAYTLAGDNKSFGNHSFGVINFGVIAPTDRMYHRIITTPNTHYKLHKGAPEPTKKPGELVWDILKPEITVFDDGAPGWYLPFPAVSYSTYNNWEEVGSEVTRLFQSNFQPGPLVKAEADRFVKESDTEEEKVVAAIRFVQNDIRYLGIETGASGFIPYSPEKVIKQRYGDCKDKSQLLVALLKEMGIKAFPVLVNTTYQDKTRDWWPSLGVFDHCIVEVNMEDRDPFWIDPTRNSQTGSPWNFYVGDYRVGLKLDGKSQGLTDIALQGKYLLSSTETIGLRAPGQKSTMVVKSDYSSLAADIVRAQYQSSSIKDAQKSLEEFYDHVYKGIKTTQEAKLADDSTTNVFSLEENYFIPDPWKPNDDKKLAVTISPLAFSTLFAIQYAENRNSPISLRYPLDLSHTIKILPDGYYALPNLDMHIANSFFEFSREVTSNRITNIILINYTFRSLKDHVPTDKVDEFTQDYNKMAENLDIELWQINNSSISDLDKTYPLLITLALGLAAIGFFFFIRWAIRR